MSINICLVTKLCPWKNEAVHLKEDMVRMYQRMMHVQLTQSELDMWTVACQAPLSMGFSRQ